MNHVMQPEGLQEESATLSLIQLPQDGGRTLTQAAKFSKTKSINHILIVDLKDKTN
jgi:hypothetical protein